MLVIIGIILFVCGMGIIEYNVNNDTKHNILIGVCGYLVYLGAIACFGLGLNIF